MAQCSLSTGISSPAPGCSRTRRTTGPAAMSDSLLASASRLPAPSDGERDAEPGEAHDPVDAHVAQRRDVGERVGRRRSPRCPAAPAPAARPPACRRRWRRRPAAIAAPAPRARRPTTRRPSAATENRSRSASITSSACIPIDPVDPATTTEVVTGKATDERHGPEHEGRLRRPLVGRRAAGSREGRLRHGCRTATQPSARPSGAGAAQRRLRAQARRGEDLRRRSP